jgi:hypothetical protein
MDGWTPGELDGDVHHVLQASFISKADDPNPPTHDDGDKPNSQLRAAGQREGPSQRTCIQ